MADLHPSITQLSLDGKCPTPSFQFSAETPYDTSASLTTPQLIKFQDLNYFTNGRVLTSMYVENLTTDELLTVKLHEYKSGAWTEVSSVLGIFQVSYLSTYQDCSDPTKLYVCTSAEQEGLIPNKSTRSWIYNKVNSLVTHENKDSFRTISKDGGFQVIPIASMMLTSADGLNPTYLAAVINTKGYLGTAIISASQVIDQSKVNLLSVSESLLPAGSQPKTIEERVSDLESEVDVIQAQMSSIDSRLDAIQTKLSKILSATSTFFVSR